MYYGSKDTKTPIKFFKRLGVYKASNVIFYSERMEAFSYGHWKFVSKFKGKLIFGVISEKKSYIIQTLKSRLMS